MIQLGVTETVKMKQLSLAHFTDIFIQMMTSDSIFECYHIKAYMMCYKLLIT